MGKQAKHKFKTPGATKNGQLAGTKNTKNEDESVIDPIIPVGSAWHIAIATGIFVSVYIKCTAASIPSGDAGDFILSAYHFGVAHPPGYPLYVTLGHIWMKFLPFGDPAFKLNLLTSVIGGLAASLIYLITFKITEYIPSAILASGLFGFSHLIWFHSVGAEIFSLNNMFCGLLLLWVVRFQHAAVSHRAQVAMEASFISGLSMCNQHTSGLFIAVIGAWMFISLIKDKAITTTQFVRTGAAFVLALLPYVQLPVSAYMAMSPSSWGDQRTFKGFWVHITREEYGTFRLTADDRVGDVFGNIKTYTEDLVHELGTATLIFSVICVLSAWFHSKIRTIVYVYVVTVFGYVMFFCMQANIDHSRNLMKGVLERFWMQSNIVVSILSGCGLWSVHTTIATRIPRADKVLSGLAGIGALALTLNQIMLNYKVCDLSQNLIMRDYGRMLLDSVPPNSVLMVEGDMPSLTSRYLRYCEGYRPDVDIVDQELIGFPWFKPMHSHIYKHYVFPYDRELYYKQVLARKGEDKPFSYNFADVFHTHLLDNIPLFIYPFMKHGDEEWKAHFELWPTNMIYTVRRKSNPFTLDEFIELADQADHNNDNLEYCDSNLYPVRSWEYVIAEACGHTAFFPAEHAHRVITTQQIHDKAEGQAVLIKTFKLYQKADEELSRTLEDGSTKHYYGVDHNKNYGVVAYLIYTFKLRINKRTEAAKFGRIMVQQFTFYFNRLSPDEPPDSSIQAVVTDAMSRYPDLLTNTNYDM